MFTNDELKKEEKKARESRAKRSEIKEREKKNERLNQSNNQMEIPETDFNEENVQKKFYFASENTCAMLIDQMKEARKKNAST